MKKKPFIITLIGLWLGCQAAWAAQSPSLPASKPPTVKEKSSFPDIQKIINGGVLKIAICKDERPPFFFTNKEGKLVGVDIKLAEAIAAALGVKPKFIQTAANFDDVVDQVSKGEAHIAISKLGFTEKRFKKVIYAYPYITLRLALLVNRAALEKISDKKSLSSIFATNHLSICTPKGTSKVEYAHQMFPTADVIQTNSYDESYDKVLKGECFACLSDDTELRKLLLKNPAYNLSCAVIVLDEMKNDLNIIANPSLKNIESMLKNFVRNRFDLCFELDAVYKDYEQEIKEYTPPKKKS